MTATGPSSNNAEERAPILVVDDEADVRTMLRTLFELDGYVVLDAEDGQEAWRIIKTRRPAVAVVDVRMPGMGGLELCRKSRENGPRGVKIIVYTAGRATREEAEKAGCDAYFLKTDPLPRLREAVNRLYAMRGT